jgi:hypothetical protein
VLLHKKIIALIRVKITDRTAFLSSRSLLLRKPVHRQSQKGKQRRKKDIVQIACDRSQTNDTEKSYEEWRKTAERSNDGAYQTSDQKTVLLHSLVPPMLRGLLQTVPGAQAYRG